MVGQKREITPAIAVDFDGTLCKVAWPKIGEPNMPLIEFLIQWREEGNKVILWSCRHDQMLKDAVDWSRQHGLEFDAVNDNLPDRIAKYGNNSRKVSADYYIDDLNATALIGSDGKCDFIRQRTYADMCWKELDV